MRRFSNDWWRKPTDQVDNDSVRRALGKDRAVGWVLPLDLSGAYGESCASFNEHQPKGGSDYAGIESDRGKGETVRW